MVNNRQIVKEQLKNRRCIICGINQDSIELYHSFEDKVSIDGFITAFNRELKTFDIDNVNTYLLTGEELKDGQFPENPFYIICDRENDTMYAPLLNTMGKKEYVDYIFSDVLDVCLSNKQICLLMGTEVIKQLSNVLKLCENFNNQYTTWFFSQDELINPYCNRKLQYTHIGYLSDLYIRSNSNMEMFSSKILNFEQSGCNPKIITISDYGFSGYYPQHSERREDISRWLYRKFIRENKYYGTLALARNDTNIEKYVNQGKSADEIIEILSDEAFYKDDQIENHMKMCLDILQKSEDSSTIKIGDYIAPDVEGNVPFLNLDEWNPHVLRNVLEEVLNIVGVDDNIPEEIDDIVLKTCGSELLIYPSVAKYYGLKVKDKYKVAGFIKNYYLTFEEYVRLYVDAMYDEIKMEELSKKGKYL